MRAFVLDALPDEVSEIKTILQDRLEIRAREPKAKFVQHGPAEHNKRVLAARVQFENALHHGSKLRVHVNRTR